MKLIYRFLNALFMTLFFVLSFFYFQVLMQWILIVVVKCKKCDTYLNFHDWWYSHCLAKRNDWIKAQHLYSCCHAQFLQEMYSDHPDNRQISCNKTFSEYYIGLTAEIPCFRKKKGKNVLRLRHGKYRPKNVVYNFPFVRPAKVLICYFMSAMYIIKNEESIPVYCNFKT